MMAGNGAYVIFVIQPDGNDGNTFKGVMQRLSKAVVITIVRCAASAGVVAGEFLVFMAESKATYGIGKKGYNEKERQVWRCEAGAYNSLLPIHVSGIICVYERARNPNYVSAPPWRQRAKRRISSASRCAVSTSAWLRFTSIRLRQPSSTSSICFATMAGSSTSRVVNSS